MLKPQAVLPLVDVTVELPEKEGYYVVVFRDSTIGKVFFMPKDGILKAKFNSRNEDVTHWLRPTPTAEESFVLNETALFNLANAFYKLGREEAAGPKTSLHKGNFESTLEYLYP